MDKLVFFHKTPALWNKSNNLPKEATFHSVSQLKKQLPNRSLSSEMSEFFLTDVYFQMCRDICNHLDIKEIHIIHGFEEGEQRNWSVHKDEGWCEVEENITYWSFTNAEKLVSFMDASIIFTRGNYPLLHQWLSANSDSHPQRFWLHYPATSIRFPHIERYEKKIKEIIEQDNNDSSLQSILLGMGIEHKFKPQSSSLKEGYSELLEFFREQQNKMTGGPYTMVLADDKYNHQVLKNIFPNSLIQTFVKPAIWDKESSSVDRVYDLIYCGTTLQKTKNHQCFSQLLKHLDSYTNSKLVVVIAGNKNDSNALQHLFEYPFSNINLLNMGEVSRSDLQTLFSKSKTMIVTSGRDANPRIIQESLVHGARVLVVDTLSDGLDFISSNPLLGAILPSDTGKWRYERNGNLSFNPTIKLASLIEEQIKKSNFPDLVVEVCRRKLSIEQSVLPLVNTIKSFR